MQVGFLPDKKEFNRDLILIKLKARTVINSLLIEVFGVGNVGGDYM